MEKPDLPPPSYMQATAPSASELPMGGPYQGPYQIPAQTVMSPPMVQMHPVYIAPGSLSPVFLTSHPVQAHCRNCNQTVTTRVETESGVLTLLAAGGIALTGCLCGCCLIPFCVDGCKDAVHYCPSCSCFLGKYSRL